MTLTRPSRKKIRVVASLLAVALSGAGVVATVAPASAASSIATNTAANIEVLAQTQDPAAIWAKMSASERQAVKDEFSLGYVSTTVTNTPSSRLDDAKFAGCWSRAGEAVFYGGVTKDPLFSVGQRTEVCVKKDKVNKVSVLNPYSKSYGRFGISVRKPTTAKHNAGWEGRGVARTEGVFGMDIPGVGPIGAVRTICAKLYLNADGHSLRGSEECHA